MTPNSDRELGMHRKITRRDFLNGVALTAGAALLSKKLLAQDQSAACTLSPIEAEKFSPYYPPALTGLRGSHAGASDAAHCLRDDTFFQTFPTSISTGESYDLIVVGGGISGLAAAHFYRKQAGPNARILILENHDDFGGHAKRNEFTIGGKTLIGYGGTYSIESPDPYSQVSQALIEELGINVASFPKYLDRDLYRAFGRSPKIFFDKENFGVDRLVDDPWPFPGGETYDLAVPAPGAWERFMKDAPIAAQAREDVRRLCTEKKDYFPALNVEQKKDKLARISYSNYLSDMMGMHPDVLRLYQTLPQPLFGYGIEAIPAIDAWEAGYPGFAGMFGESEGLHNERVHFFHFPDGNASIARLLIRKLIPQAIPGSSATDVVTARADYSKLDEKNSPVRLRLNSTVVRVKHMGDPARATEVEIAYAHDGKVFTTRAKHCVLACWNMMIPYLCSELPAEQSAALASATKVPLLYTNVLLRDGKAFQKLGANAIYAPNGYHTLVDVDLPVSIGGYRCPQNPDEPMIIHMSKSPCEKGLPPREQHRMGRIELFTTPFETMEHNVREQLTRILGPGGFDPARDIAAITVNRWPHGYAYDYNSLYDKFVLEGGETPCERARKPFGRITIANSDAGAHAFTNVAIDQAWRAVGELKA
jgi:spermidine dehydrogenase